MRLPGLIDVHVHMREPGAAYKEDWDSGTASALAGGITMVLAMPNTAPPIFDLNTLNLVLSKAEGKARCDYAQFVGAGPGNALEAASLSSRVAGLKMYLDMTYGELRLDDMTLWQQHYLHWPPDYPIVVHAEQRTMAAAILFASIYDQSIHIAHVSLREEIETIKAAKEKGIKVTCEVAPHHLFLSSDDFPELSENGKFLGRKEVRPHLASSEDQQSLWQNLDVIDCFATDHAPHTIDEKDGPNPPPGFPGLETALPLLLTAVHDGRLTIDDIIDRMYLNPSKIFKLPKQPETWIEVDLNHEHRINAADTYTKCGWTPFDSWKVRGRVSKVVLRGETAFENGNVLVNPGFGMDVRSESYSNQ
jgi:carbamoyl-phosphate synthase/aspartate carbamoyltransferase/dihydroorotase